MSAEFIQLPHPKAPEQQSSKISVVDYGELNVSAHELAELLHAHSVYLTQGIRRKNDNTFQLSTFTIFGSFLCFITAFQTLSSYKDISIISATFGALLLLTSTLINPIKIAILKTGNGNKKSFTSEIAYYVTHLEEISKVGAAMLQEKSRLTRSEYLLLDLRMGEADHAIMDTRDYLKEMKWKSN